MVLDGHRAKVDCFLMPVAKRLSNVDPNVISWLGLITAFISGLLMYFSFNNHSLLLIGAAVVLVSGYFDALDGKVAKLTGKASKKGDYLDHVFDRYSDLFMIGGVAISSWCNPYLGLLALVGVMLTSYMGTQAQAVGAPRLYAGLLGRADRVVLTVLFPVLQYVMCMVGFESLSLGNWDISWMEIMVLYFALMGNITAVQRIIITWRNLSKSDKG